MKPRLVIAALASLLLLGALYFLALAPYRPLAADTAWLRLSWRIRGAAEEHCRERTAEELAKLPVHMRTPRVCERESVEYELSVSVDGRQLVERELSGSGAREDRPIYVLEDIALAPGAHRVQVELIAEHDEDDREVPAITFDETIDFERGRIELIGLAGGTLKRIPRTAP